MPFSPELPFISNTDLYPSHLALPGFCGVWSLNNGTLQAVHTLPVTSSLPRQPDCEADSMSFQNRVPHSSCQLWTTSSCPSRNVWASSVRPPVAGAVRGGGAVCLGGSASVVTVVDRAAGLSHLRTVFISPGIGVALCPGSGGMWPPHCGLRWRPVLAPAAASLSAKVL